MKSLYFTLTLCLFSILSAAQQNWEQAKDKNGIKVFTSKPEGQALEDVKITTKIKAPISQIVDILEDVSQHTEWMYGVKSSVLIDGTGNGSDHFFQYQIIDMPFPTKDRDIIVEYKKKIEKDGNTVIIDSKANTTLKQPTDDYIRITDFESSYVLTKIDDHTTDVEYLLSADPGGKLAKWIINMFTTKGPFESMNELKKRAEK